MHDQRSGPPSLLRISGALIIFFSLPLVIGACSNIGEDPRPGAEPNAVETRGRLELAFSTTEARFDPAAEVPLKLEITNRSDRPAELSFSSSKTHDFTVKTEGGRVVWRWSDDRFFAQAMITKSLAPGESWILSASWDQTTTGGEDAPPGRYTIEAALEAIDSGGAIGPLAIELVGE
jgi:hypothetical protein